MGTYEVEKKVQLYIKNNAMIEPGDRILIGVSGGADSVCLLLLLQALGQQMDFNVSVLHVHHGVRKEADQDAAYVEALCRELGVPFFLEQVDMLGFAKEQGLSEEEAGRTLRYRLFDIYRQKLHCNLVAVAHHQNDRAETMLFHLFRGTGIQGLASVRPVREHVIRPLLCLTREDIENYLAACGRTYCQDITNGSDAYSRNKIRHHVIPYVEQEICGQAVEHMNRTAAQLAEITDYLNLQTVEAFEACKAELPKEQKDRPGIALRVPAFTSFHRVIQNRVLLYTLEQLTPYRKDITQAHITSVLSLLSNGGTSFADLPYGLVAEKSYDRLLLYEKQDRNEGRQEADRQREQQIVPGVTYELPNLGRICAKIVEEEEKVREIYENIPVSDCIKCFDYDKIKNAVMIRTRRSGDYITCDAALHRKRLQDYMVNEKIPSRERDRKWLLADGNHILWIPGYRISEYYKVSKNTKCIFMVQVQEEENGGTC